MTTHAVLSVFENYQSARTKFVQTVADLAMRPQNIEALQNAGAMQLLRPLLLDTVPSVQHTAALAIGRMANYSEGLAEAVVMNEVLPQLVYSLSEQNRYYKKAAAFVLRSIAKHSPELAQSVVDAGALESLVDCLSDFEPTVKEGAAWALGYIARHTAELAQAVVDAGAVPQLILCIQEPELATKRIAASALSEIAKHNADLAQAVVDGGAISYLVPLVQHPDTKIKRQVCSCLAQIIKHSVELAEVVVEAEIFPKILTTLKDSDAVVRKNACTVIREVSKHTQELARLIVNAGGHAALVEYASECTGNSRLPALMALGYIGAFSDTLALAIIVAQGVLPLKDALVNETEDYIKAAAAWSLGQLGRHTPDHAKQLAQAEVLQVLAATFMDHGSSEDLQTKCKSALKSVVQKCTALEALEPMIFNAPTDVMKYILQQFAKVLPNDGAARKSFAKNGCLKHIQQIRMGASSEGDEGDSDQLLEFIETINKCFPSELVQVYSPDYTASLLKKLEDEA